MTIVCRGVRGATTIENDSPEEVLAATGELLQFMVRANHIDPEDVASVFLTTTPDVVSEYPALAARQLGWIDTPLICGHEMAVPHGLEKCIRILLHWNTTKRAKEIHHVYLKKARSLRPDIMASQKLPDLVSQNGKEKGT